MKTTKTMKTATIEELNSWLMELEMSNSFLKYKDTIAAIKAEIERRSGVKVRKARKPRKLQEVSIFLFANGSDEMVIQVCENTTVKALNDFIKRTGLKIKRSLRKAEKIAAIIESLKTIRNMTTAEKLEALKAGKIDKFSLLSLCSGDTLREFAKILSIPEKASCGWYFRKDELTSMILERLAA